MRIYYYSAFNFVEYVFLKQLCIVFLATGLLSIF